MDEPEAGLGVAMEALSGLRRRELGAFLEHLREHRVLYSILHPFPERGFAAETDLDVYVERKRFPEIESFLLGAGWSKDSNVRFPADRKFFSKLVGGSRLKLDISLELALFNVDSRFVYAGELPVRVGSDGFRYLDDRTGYFFLLKKTLLKGGPSEEKRRDLTALIERSPQLSAEFGADPFSPANVDSRFVSSRAGRLSPVRWLMAYAGRVCLAQAPTVVAFVGLDGAGKGTYLELLKSELVRRNIQAKAIYLGYSAYRLPGLRKIAALKADRGRGIVRKLLTLAQLVLLPVEFLLRRGNGRYDLILTDRHPLYEPVFGRGPMRWFDALLVRISPKPDLVVFLTGDARTLWTRKQEVEFSEYLRQKERLERAVRERSTELETVEIDTGDRKEEVFRKVLGAVTAHV